MDNKEKISVITLGCSKNTVDSERIISQLKLNDFEIIDDPEQADSVIVNTCGFIEAAKEESINTILNAVELKKLGNLKKVYVAGCLSERYAIDLQKDIPEVDRYFGTEDYGAIVSEFGGNLKKELLGERELLTPKHYAYLKISEGCDNPCSFCAIPIMRGGHISKPIEKLEQEVNLLATKGVRELIVIGQDTTDYGIDLYGKRRLAELLNKISENPDINWIKLLYAYPSHFPNNAIEAISDNPKICNYIDMPLQHISDNVLKSMRRGITKRRTVELIDNLKNRIPGLCLRTTMISGYPAETDADFDELCSFVNDVEFDRLGVFDYSPEENTNSFSMGDPISPELKEERRQILMEIQKDISLKKNNSLIGQKIEVIIDDIRDESFIGRSYRDVPEVDGEVIIESMDEYLHKGSFYTVEINDCNDYDLFGNFRR